MSALRQPLDPYRPLPRVAQREAMPVVGQPGQMRLLSVPGQAEPLARRPNRTDRHLGSPNRRPTPATVSSLAAAQPMPAGLRLLMTAQQVATPCAFLALGAIAIVYGWTVYTQQIWSQQYQRLVDLRQQERQLIAADEVLKNQLAQQALQADSGLIPASLSSTVFLEAPAAPPALPTAPEPEVAEPDAVNAPFAY